MAGSKRTKRAKTTCDHDPPPVNGDARVPAPPDSRVSCSICLDTVSDNGGRCRSAARLECGHEFHLDCIGSTFNVKGAMQCPNCRNVESGQWQFASGSPSPTEFSVEDLYREYWYWEQQSELEELRSLLEQERQWRGREITSLKEKVDQVQAKVSEVTQSNAKYMRLEAWFELYEKDLMELVAKHKREMKDISPMPVAASGSRDNGDGESTSRSDIAGIGI